MPKTLATAIGCLLAAAAIFYLGMSFSASERRVIITDKNEIISEDFALFWEAVDLIKQRYVHADDVSDKDFLYGAIKGVISALDDPYSSFLSPDESKRFEQNLAGSFGGIGAEIGIRGNQLIVVAPLKGNPAEKVGLKSGDRILEIDGLATNGLTIEEAVSNIRGMPGTVVKLLIFRDGWDETKEIPITRAIVEIPTVEWIMRDNSIGYFQIYNFNGNMPLAFDHAVLEAIFSGMNGMIIDLRNNPGGFLDAAVYLEGWFLKRGDIAVIERFANGEQRPLLANGNEALSEIPVVVLVNGGTASASEILAGALRDLRGAKLVGEKTYGKGSVQEVDTLSDGSTVKVSIAAWLTPAGHEIDKVGLTPDIEIELTDDDIEADRDPQFQKALEVIRGLIPQT